jgi:hypothetical protein
MILVLQVRQVLTTLQQQFRKVWESLAGEKVVPVSSWIDALNSTNHHGVRNSNWAEVCQSNKNN